MPVISQRQPVGHFARFSSLLEETSYLRLVGDDRELAEPNPTRDLFLERARLGLLELPDTRLAAGSRAVYRSSNEKHGGMRRRESILPVELVLRGGLEDLGLAAFPRVRLPSQSPDAFLYR